MSSTIPFFMVRDPKLLDVVDEDWEKDVLPEDGKMLLYSIITPQI